MAITESLPQLLADLRAMRDEVDASPTRKGGDPLAGFANDLAVLVVTLGGIDPARPLQRSGREPDVERLLEDLARFREANAPREKRTKPAVISVAVTQPWRF